MSMARLVIFKVRGVEGFLLVVAVMEGAVGNSEISLHIVPARVLSVAFEKGQRRDEVSLLQEM